MKASKGSAVVLIAIVAVVAVITIGFSGAGDVGAWFIQGTLDRVNPLVAQVTAYANAPAPDAYFDSYADASGGGENYVYEIRACDENGVEHKANLISFGVELDGGEDGYLELSVKGSYVHRWEYVAADAIPAAAVRALG